MNPVSIKIASDFSDAPGARYRKDGADSGEEFFEDKLSPAFELAQKENTKLIIDLDGTWGYATSFLSEAFGLLSMKYGGDVVNKVLELVSFEDPALIEYIHKLIENPNAK